MENGKKVERTIKIIVCSLLVIWLFIVFILSPLGIVVGVLNGDLDIVTLEPMQEQIRGE